MGDAAVELAGGSPTRTDEHGRFAIHGLRPGPHVVQAVQGNRASAPARIHLAPGGPPAVLRLFDAARLSVTVVSGPTREPLAGALVQIRAGDSGEPLIRSGISDEHGQVEIRGLSPGGYMIAATADGFEGIEQQLPPRAGLDWSHVLVLQPGAAVEGRVVDEHDRPISGATVSALPEPKAHRVPVTYRGQFDVSTDEDGRFMVPAVAAGATTLRVTHPSYLPAWSSEIIADGRTARTGVLIALREGASIEGHVVTTSGAPAAFATVRLGTVDSMVYGGGRRRTTCDEAGRFRIAGLPATAVDVVASSDQSSSETVRVDLASSESAPGGSMSGLVIELVLDLSISGIVTDPDDQPIAGATVVCVGQPSGAIGTRPVLPETTGETGRFSCGGLAPGSYELTAMKPGGNNNAGPWQRSAGAVADAGDDAVVIMIPNDGGLQGRVRTQQGTVPEAFGIEIDDGGLPRIFRSRDGAFVMDGLAPRTYQLVVTIPGERATLPVTIPEGGILELGTISLQAVPEMANDELPFRPPGPPLDVISGR